MKLTFTLVAEIEDGKQWEANGALTDLIDEVQLWLYNHANVSDGEFSSVITGDLNDEEDQGSNTEPE